MRKRTISGTDMEAVFCSPSSEAPRRAIVLLSGSSGGLLSTKYGAMVEGFVSQGYAVLDLAYFRQGKLPHRLRRIPLEYFENALRWLSGRSEVVPDQL